MSELTLCFVETFPHPIDKVWRSITTRQGLEAWLMRNDFELELGRECTFRFCASDGEEESLVYVKVVEIDAPQRMVWYWRNEDEPTDSTVVFRLRDVEEGTELTLEHFGPVSASLADALNQGWPTKLAELREYLEIGGPS